MSWELVKYLEVLSNGNFKVYFKSGSERIFYFTDNKIKSAIENGVEIR